MLDLGDCGWGSALPASMEEPPLSRCRENVHIFAGFHKQPDAPTHITFWRSWVYDVYEFMKTPSNGNCSTRNNCITGPASIGFGLNRTIVWWKRPVILSHLFSKDNASEVDFHICHVLVMQILLLKNWLKADFIHLALELWETFLRKALWTDCLLKINGVS